MLKEYKLPIQRLTSLKRHYFFGYYDIQAFSHNGKYHLYHQVAFNNRLPKQGDEAVIGLIDLENRTINPVGHTKAWNFQQGSMLQWSPAAPNRELIFNDYIDGRYRGVVMDIYSGRTRLLEVPIACVDPFGKYCLSLNFCRLFRYRPGYGYPYLSDPYENFNHPKQDGVFRCDLQTGKNKLVLSLEKIWRFALKYYRLEEDKLILNHLTFNPDGTRFVLIARSDQSTKKRRVSIVITSDLEGANLHCLRNQAFASHYFWKDSNHLLIYCRHRQGKQLYLWKDDISAVPKVIDPTCFLADGHCSYSPDRRWILYDDSNPTDNQRNLYLYQNQQRKGYRIGNYYADPRLYQISRDIRCDLHPRWNRSGTAISFDSVHEGTRQIYLMDVRELY